MFFETFSSSMCEGLFELNQLLKLCFVYWHTLISYLQFFAEFIFFFTTDNFT